MKYESNGLPMFRFLRFNKKTTIGTLEKDVLLQRIAYYLHFSYRMRSPFPIKGRN